MGNTACAAKKICPAQIFISVLWKTDSKHLSIGLWIHPFRYCFNYEWVSSKLPIDWCMNMESCMQFCNQATPLDDFVIPLLLLSFRICKRFTWARFIYTRKENQWLKVCMHPLKNPALIWSYQLRAMTYIFLNKIASFLMQEREKKQFETGLEK